MPAGRPGSRFDGVHDPLDGTFAPTRPQSVSLARSPRRSHCPRPRHRWSRPALAPAPGPGRSRSSRRVVPSRHVWPSCRSWWHAICRIHGRSAGSTRPTAPCRQRCWVSGPDRTATVCGRLATGVPRRGGSGAPRTGWGTARPEPPVRSRSAPGVRGRSGRRPERRPVRATPSRPAQTTRSPAWSCARCWPVAPRRGVTPVVTGAARDRPRPRSPARRTTRCDGSTGSSTVGGTTSEGLRLRDDDIEDTVIRRPHGTGGGDRVDDLFGDTVIRPRDGAAGARRRAGRRRSRPGGHDRPRPCPEHRRTERARRSRAGPPVRPCRARGACAVRPHRRPHLPTGPPGDHRPAPVAARGSPAAPNRNS